MNKNKYAGKLLVLLLVLTQNLSYVHAAEIENSGLAVRIAGELVFINKSANKSRSIQERTQTIQDNLDGALLSVKALSPSCVAVTYYNGIPIVTLGGYKVVTVDEDNAKAYHTTPAKLAQLWVLAIQRTLADKDSVEAYISQIRPIGNNPNVTSNNDAAVSRNNSPTTNNNANNLSSNDLVIQNLKSANRTSFADNGQFAYKSRVVFANQGTTMVCKLKTALSSTVNQEGDPVECVVTKSVSNEYGEIPKNSILYGDVESTKNGKMLSRSGALSVRFTSIKLPSGEEYPISAHLVGTAGKYATASDANGSMQGETWKSKVGRAAMFGLMGAAAGAALGTGVGAISGLSAAGAGAGAWSGTAIGSVAGAGGGLLFSHGKNVELKSGSQLNVQLDEPLSVAGNGQNSANTMY